MHVLAAMPLHIAARTERAQGALARGDASKGTNTFARLAVGSMASGVLALGLAWSGPAFADIREARDLMEASRFEEAYDLLAPAARSGNADAEELIGVMYAMGLGRPRDDERAFDWYLRASLKGHPGAQSGIGWYYEVGRGMPAPDLVRAYAWYTLSAMGGDPDAAISQEEIAKRMEPDEIARALRIVDDYAGWLYPDLDPSRRR